MQHMHHTGVLNARMPAKVICQGTEGRLPLACTPIMWAHVPHKY